MSLSMTCDYCIKIELKDCEPFLYLKQHYVVIGGFRVLVINIGSCCVRHAFVMITLLINNLNLASRHLCLHSQNIKQHHKA